MSQPPSGWPGCVPGHDIAAACVASGQSAHRAHVLLCWLALLLIRLAETATADTWRNLRHQLDRMHLGTFTGEMGTMRRRTATLPEQAAILRALKLPEPSQFVELTPPTPA